MKIIPINNGYYQYKSIDNQMFKSRLDVDTYGSIHGNFDTLVFDDEKYVIGIGKPNMDFDKASNEFTKIFVLNMLARFTVEEESFRVVLSTPPLMYGKQKDTLPEYLINDRYEVRHNGRKKVINISDVKVFPETIAAYVANKDRFKGKNVVVIDIGGLTTNGVLIKNGGFGKDDIFTIRHGMYHLDFDISQYLISSVVEPGFNCEPEDVQYFRDIRDGVLDCEGVIDIYRRFVDEIVEKMDDKNWNYNKYEILITGGGGKNLFEIIQMFVLPRAVLSNDPLFDNLRGLEALGKKVWG